MKLSALLFLCSLPVLPGAAHTFRDTEGTTIEGEVAKATASTVTIRTADGSLASLPLARLSKVDREHVAHWLAEPLPELHVLPHFSFDHEGSSESRELLNLSARITTSPGTEPVEARVHYFLIGRCMVNQSNFKVLSVQSADLELAPGDPASVSFKPVTNYYVASKEAGKGASCIGYVLQTTRRSDGRELHSLGSIPLLQEHLEAILALDVGEETNQEFVPIKARPGGLRTVSAK